MRWYKTNDNKQIPSTDFSYWKEPFHITKKRLEIKNVTAAEIGEYTCETQRQAVKWKSTDSINIKLNYPNIMSWKINCWNCCYRYLVKNESRSCRTMHVITPNRLNVQVYQQCSWRLIVQVSEVLRKTVDGSDWRFNGLSGGHLQSQVKSHSSLEDDRRWGRWNVSHYH